MDDALISEALPDVLRPFEQPLSDASHDTVRSYLERLRVALRDVRSRSSQDHWTAVTDALRRHPVSRFMCQAPLVRRALEKPRGYPGDAVMIDYIYRASSVAAEVETLSPQAALVHEFVNSAAAPRAVRYRREFAARTIDEIVAKRGVAARVVSIAAGHLREAELSEAARAGRVEFVAIDQDAESLRTIRCSAGSMTVDLIQASVRQILSGKLRIPAADLVYALGLFDYLDQSVAARLADIMLDAVRPGGILLIPNFLAGIEDASWMESFMDWKLIYRRDAEMLDLLGDWTHVAHAEIHHDPDHNITFLKVHKR